MTKSTNVLPGLLDNNVEMFVENDNLKIINNGKVISFEELSLDTIALLEKEMYKDDNVLISVFELHPRNRMKRIKQFATCRFGGLDFKADIQKETIQEGEYWECPKRGTCPHEGVLCKLPVVNGQRLSVTDVKILQLSATDKTNDVIAEEMNLPLGTLHKHKKILWKFLRIQTKQEATLLSKFYNLL